MLSRNLWINQQQLGEHLQLAPWLSQGLPMKEMVGSVPAAVYQTLLSQAAEISYMNDFRLLMWINMAAIPLVFLLRHQRRA